MIKYAAALAIAGVVGLGAAPAQESRCLHGPAETPAQAARRQAALGFARAVNTVENMANQQGHTYYALSDLPGLPRVPDGFQAHLSTDGGSYAFSVKDTLDACRFAFFSDQDGLIYNATPLR